MAYRKGELTAAQIDRGWPHQVVLPARVCTGPNYITLRLFCDDLSLCNRGHFFWRDSTGFSVFCFSEKERAERFEARFGGELIAPKDRPRRPGGKRW